MDLGMDTPLDPGSDMGPGVGKVALRYLRFAHRVKEINFFLAFLSVSEHFKSIETHFFSKIFVSAKRKMRASETSKM